VPLPSLYHDGPRRSIASCVKVTHFDATGHETLRSNVGGVQAICRAIGGLDSQGLTSQLPRGRDAFFDNFNSVALHARDTL